MGFVYLLLVAPHLTFTVGNIHNANVLDVKVSFFWVKRSICFVVLQFQPCQAHIHGACFMGAGHPAACETASMGHLAEQWDKLF